MHLSFAPFFLFFFSLKCNDDYYCHLRSRFAFMVLLTSFHQLLFNFLLLSLPSRYVLPSLHPTIAIEISTLNRTFIYFFISNGLQKNKNNKSRKSSIWWQIYNNNNDNFHRQNMRKNCIITNSNHAVRNDVVCTHLPTQLTFMI